MVAVDLRQLIGRLDDTCRGALEDAARLAQKATHYSIEVEHLLYRLVERSGTDASAILDHYGLDIGRISADLTRAMDRMRRGNAREPSLSPEVVELLKQAWLFASLDQRSARLRSGHLFWALLA